MSLKRIILVEDDPDDRDLFNLFYSGRNDLTLLPSLENGEALITYLNTAPATHLPDLIVLDHNMPRMNGQQTLAHLKSNAAFSNIRAVVYSTYTDTRLVDEYLRLGAYMVTLKPVDDAGYQKMMDDFLQVL